MASKYFTPLVLPPNPTSKILVIIKVSMSDLGEVPVIAGGES